MTQSKRTKDALLNRSVAAMQAGRAAASGVDQGAGVVWVPVAEVMADPDQPRTHFDEERMRALVASIAALGQIEPILVQALRPEEQRANPGFRFRCLSGHRRLRAHAELGLAEVKAVVVREPLAPAERLVREIASNEVREDHTDYDRARFFAQIFANRIDGLASGGGVERVKQLVNRAFNELDRSGAFSADSQAIVDAFEAELKAIGERRNLRWFHRWGAPLLALEGAALVAAVGGLDARRALAISQLSPRTGAMRDLERQRRESAVSALAERLQREGLPHRAVAAAVKSIEGRLAAGEDPAAAVEAALAEISEDSPSAVAPPSPRNRAARSAGGAAEALAPRPQPGRWGVRLGAGDRYTDIAGFIDSLETVAPRRAERIARLLARLEDEVMAAQALLSKRKR